MTKSVCVAKRLQERCPNKGGHQPLWHVRLESGRTKAAQEYFDELCRAICRGMIEQVDADRKGEFFIASIDKDGSATSSKLLNVQKELRSRCKIVEEEEDEPMMEAYDDVSGAQLDFKKVQIARREEVQYVREMQLYDKVPINERKQRTGKSPTTVRWIDINKGDEANPDYRSRLAVREINTYKREDLFAATPPLEALKTIFSLTVTSNKGEVVMVNDIRRAFFHAKAERDVYVQLAPEDTLFGEEDLSGKLRFSMYGTYNPWIFARVHCRCSQRP